MNFKDFRSLQNHISDLAFKKIEKIRRDTDDLIDANALIWDTIDSNKPEDFEMIVTHSTGIVIYNLIDIKCRVGQSNAYTGRYKSIVVSIYVKKGSHGDIIVFGDSFVRELPFKTGSDMGVTSIDVDTGVEIISEYFNRIKSML